MSNVKHLILPVMPVPSDMQRLVTVPKEVIGDEQNLDILVEYKTKEQYAMPSEINVSKCQTGRWVEIPVDYTQGDYCLVVPLTNITPEQVEELKVKWREANQDASWNAVSPVFADIDPEQGYVQDDEEDDYRGDGANDPDQVLMSSTVPKDLPPVGCPVMLDGKQVGKVTELSLSNEGCVFTASILASALSDISSCPHISVEIKRNN